MNNIIPQVTVIINCYNGSEFVDSAISTVLAQTYINWQIVFWDNQSTEDIKSIVEKYNDKRIHYYLAPEHTPLGEARNLAMMHAITDFICFLDIDDLWDETFLQKTIEILRNEQYTLCYTNYYCFNSRFKKINSSNKESGIVTFGSLLDSYDIGMSGCVFRRSETVEFNTGYSLIEDYDFFLKLIHNGKGFYINEPLFSYRMHENSLTNTFKSGWGREFSEEYNFLKNVFLTPEELEEYESQLEWLQVRIVNARINESIHNAKWLDVARLCIGNCNKSLKLLFPLISIVLGERRYNRLRNRLQRSTYTV